MRDVYQRYKLLEGIGFAQQHYVSVRSGVGMRSAVRRPYTRQLCSSLPPWAGLMICERAFVPRLRLPSC